MLASHGRKGGRSRGSGGVGGSLVGTGYWVPGLLKTGGCAALCERKGLHGVCSDRPLRVTKAQQIKENCQIGVAANHCEVSKLGR